MQNRAHSCFFSGAQAAKESGIARIIAHEKGLNLSLAWACQMHFFYMFANDFCDFDQSGIVELTLTVRGKK